MNTNITLILTKAVQAGHKQRQEIHFCNVLSTGKPIWDILCTFGLKTGFWLAYLCQLQFFHLLPGMDSVFPMLKAIDLQHWATTVDGMQGDPEHWFCQSTHAGEMKNPRQDKEIPLLHKCNSTATRGGEAGKSEDHTHEQKIQKTQSCPLGGGSVCF